MHRQAPFGLYEGLSLEEGPAPYGGAERPGPLGVDPHDLRGTPPDDAEARWGPGRPAGLGTSFTLGTARYRLLRVDSEWRQSFDETEVPPEEALAALEEAARRHQESSEFAALMATAAGQLAGLHEDGVFVLVQKQSHDSHVPAAASASPASTPSALRPPAAPDMPSFAVEGPEFGLEQVAVLKDAAVAGIPFCEECARLAAQRGG